MVQWSVAMSLDCLRREFESHTSPLSNILLHGVVTSGIECPTLYMVSSASCAMDMSVVSRGIFHVSLYSQQVEINSLRKDIAIRTRRIEVSMVDLDLDLSGRLVGH